jgi:hypothetical protein
MPYVTPEAHLVYLLEIAIFFTMWATAEMTLGEITVHAQDLKSRRKGITLEPAIEPDPMSNLFPVRGPIIVDMVHTQEAFLGLAATRTALTAIRTENLTPK